MNTNESNNELVKKFSSLPYKIEAPKYIVAQYKIILNIFGPKGEWERFMAKIIANCSELKNE